jgi:hypothetical protein
MQTRDDVGRVSSICSRRTREDVPSVCAPPLQEDKCLPCIFSAHDKKKEDKEGRRRLLELTIHTTWENSCRALALGKMKNIAVRHPRRTK